MPNGHGRVPSISHKFTGEKRLFFASLPSVIKNSLPSSISLHPVEEHSCWKLRAIGYHSWVMFKCNGNYASIKEFQRLDMQGWFLTGSPKYDRGSMELLKG